MPVVTISAQYGAGGSVIAPAVAEALGLPFVDRAIPVQVAGELGVSVDESLAHDGLAENGWASRWLSGAAWLAGGGLVAPAGDTSGATLSDQAFVDHTESVLRGLATGAGAVILGRAAAVVLAEQPGALHVRLHGPPDHRVRQAVALRGVDDTTATRERADSDRARAAYVKRFYRRDPDDPCLYHLICDSTAISIDAVTSMITVAARARSGQG